MNFNTQQHPMQQNNNGSQINAQQLCCDPQTFSFNNPPPIPSISIIPLMNNYLSAATVLVANEISNNARMHAGRTFLFNQIVGAGYRGNEFGFIVSLALDIATLVYVKRGIQPEQSLAESAKDAVSIASSLNFQAYPDLRQYVDQNVYSDAMTKVTGFNDMQSNFSEAKRIAMNNQSNNSMHNNPMNGNNGMGSNFRMNSNNQMGGGGMQMPTGGSNFSVFSNGNSNGNGVQIVPTGSPAAVRQYGNSKPFVPVDVRSNQNVFIQQPQQDFQPAEIIVVEDTSTLKWASSSLQPYIVTVDPRSQKVALRVEVAENGKGVVVSYPVAMTEEEVMDRQKHTLKIDEFYMSSVPSDYHTRMASIRDGVDVLVAPTKWRNDAISAGNEDMEFINNYKHEPVENDSDTMFTSHFFEQALFAGKVCMQRFLGLDNTSCKVFRISGVISSPVLVPSNQNTLIVKLLECKTFKQMIDVIATASINKNAATLCAKIDKIFTKQINSFIRNQLGLADTNIDSFFSDAVALIDHLAKINQTYHSLYLDLQKHFVETNLSAFFIDPKTKETNYVNDLDLLVDDVSDAGFETEYLIQVNTFIYVDVHSRELGFKPDVNVGSNISDQDQPMLYRLAEDTFRKEESYEHFIAHRFIVTGDDKIYEIHKGLLGENLYTISEYN